MGATDEILKYYRESFATFVFSSICNNVIFTVHMFF